MQLFLGEKLAKITGIVGDEGKVLRDDPGHKIPVRFAAPAEPIDMKAFVAALLSDLDE